MPSAEPRRRLDLAYLSQVRDGAGLDVEVDGVAARTWGTPGGESFLLLHGIGGNAVAWDRVGFELCEHGFVVALDLPGHGRSTDAHEFGISQVASGVINVAAVLGLQSPVVVGHSWGASVAVEVAVNTPCRGLISVDGNVGSPREVFADTEIEEPNDEPGDDIYLTAADLEQMASAQIAARKAQGNEVLGEMEVAVVRRNLQPHDDGFRLRPLATERALLQRAFWNYDLTSALGGLSVPVLFAMSADTRDGGASPAASAAIRSRLDQVVTGRNERRVVWVESGHNIPLEAPAALAEAILEFLGVS